MASTMKLVAGAAVFAAILYGLRMSTNAPERMERIVSPTAQSRRTGEVLATDVRVAERSAIRAGVDGATEASDSSSGGAEAKPRDPWLLDLTVEGTGVPQRPTEVVVIGNNGLSWPDELALRITFEAPGRTEIDVRRLIALWDARYGRDRAIAGLHVRVEHPDCPSRHIRLDVISDGAKDAVPSQPLVATVTLERAAVLTGEVAFPGLDLAHDVEVLAYAMGDDSPRNAAPLAVVAPDAQGRFRVRVTPTGRTAVVALSAGFRPESRVVSIAGGSSQDLGRLEAVKGAALTGIVMFGAELVGEGAHVSVSLADLGQSWALSSPSALSGALAWRDGRFEWGSCRVRTDSKGRFRCEGLGPWPISVACVGLPEHDSFGWSEETLLVTPPAEVVVTSGAVVIELAYDFGGARATSGRLALRVADGEVVELDVAAHSAVQSPRRFTCAPEVPIVARAEFGGFEPAELSFRSPSTPGTRTRRRFELKQSTHSPASLRVRAAAEGSALPEGTILQLELTPLDPAMVHSASRRVESLTLVDGEAVLENAPLGPYRVRVFASPVAWRRTTRWVDQSFEIDLAPGDSRALRCDFVLGGNVSLEARAPEGPLVQGWCKVFDEQRREVEAEFFTDLPGNSYGGFSGRGPSALKQNLLPGRYTIELITTDYAPYTDVIEIRPGEVTSKTFQLTPR